MPLCCCSVAQLCLILCDPMDCSTPGFPVLAQTHAKIMLGHLQWRMAKYLTQLWVAMRVWMSNRYLKKMLMCMYLVSGMGKLGQYHPLKSCQMMRHDVGWWREPPLKSNTHQLCHCSSVTKSCLILCDPVDCSTPDSSVHYLPEFAQIQVHWVGDTIPSSVTPFSFCLQSFPASRSFPKSQLLPPGGQSIGASVSVLPMNMQGLFPLGTSSSSTVFLHDLHQATWLLLIVFVHQKEISPIGSLYILNKVFKVHSFGSCWCYCGNFLNVL